jgi:hypothetical protein
MLLKTMNAASMVMDTLPTTLAPLAVATALHAIPDREWEEELDPDLLEEEEEKEEEVGPEDLLRVLQPPPLNIWLMQVDRAKTEKIKVDAAKINHLVAVEAMTMKDPTGVAVADEMMIPNRDHLDTVLIII